MKQFICLLLILVTYGCGKTKTILICGDHVCINKDEANQFFEENLSLEVKIIDNKKPDNFDLVELNLKSKEPKRKQVNIYKKEKTNLAIKELSKNEIIQKKIQLKKNKELKKIKNDKKIATKVKIKKKAIKQKKIVNKPVREITDICTVLDKCSIDEISKYLVKQGRKSSFPDITAREQE